MLSNYKIINPKVIVCIQYEALYLGSGNKVRTLKYGTNNRNRYKKLVLS